MSVLESVAVVRATSGGVLQLFGLPRRQDLAHGDSGI
jgi:hypothetical protein